MGERPFFPKTLLFFDKMLFFPFPITINLVNCKVVIFFLIIWQCKRKGIIAIFTFTYLSILPQNFDLVLQGISKLLKNFLLKIFHVGLNWPFANAKTLDYSPIIVIFLFKSLTAQEHCGNIIAGQGKKKK